MKNKIDINEEKQNYSRKILLNSMIEFLYKSKLISCQEYKSLKEHVRG